MKRWILVITLLVWAVFGGVTVQGEEYGELFEAPEQQAMEDTLQYTLENNRTNEAGAWVNPDTGRSGSLLPVRTFQNEDGQYCREYVTTIFIDGEEQQGYGTACRQPDGNWKIVSEDSSVEHRTVVENTYYVNPYYPYGYADWYVRYPHYVWDVYSPGIYFSFDIVHFHRHRPVHSHSHGSKIIYVRKGARDWHVREDRHFRDARTFRNEKSFLGSKDFLSFKRYREANRIREQRYFLSDKPFRNTRQFPDAPTFRELKPFYGPGQFEGERSSPGGWKRK